MLVLIKVEIVLISQNKMLSTKCDSCKKKSWSQCYDWCLGKPFRCFVCNKIITYREKQEHMQYPYSYLRICRTTSLSKFPHLPYQYLTCRICNTNKYISQYRYKHYTCRSCIKYNRIS